MIFTRSCYLRRLLKSSDSCTKLSTRTAAASVVNRDHDSHRQNAQEFVDGQRVPDAADNSLAGQQIEPARRAIDASGPCDAGFVPRRLGRVARGEACRDHQQLVRPMSAGKGANLVRPWT